MQLAQRNLETVLQETGDPLLEEVKRVQTKNQKEMAQLSDMLFAAASGEVDIVAEAVLHSGVNVCEADYEGRTALHVCGRAAQRTRSR